jgi:hypothetical protein
MYLSYGVIYSLCNSVDILAAESTHIGTTSGQQVDVVLHS